MHVVMVTNDAFPFSGGVAAHVHNLSRALQGRGARVTVVFGSSQLAEGRTTSIDGLKYVRVPLKRGRSAYLPNTMRMVRAVKEASTASTAVLHRHDYREFLLVPAAARMRPTSVWTNHSSMFVESARRDDWPGAAMNHLAARVSSHNIAVSREIADLTTRYSGTQTHYIANGVDPERFYPGDARREAYEYLGFRSDRTNVLVPRRMVRKNGLHVLAEALHLLPEVVAEQLVVRFLAEPGRVEEPYAKMVLDRCYQSRADVAVVPAVSYAEMPDLYRASDWVCIPSLIEAVSLAALEAMASGVPIISTDAGGLVEVVVDGVTGLVAKAGDPVELCEQLRTAVEQAEIGVTLASEARNLAHSQYTWDAVAVRTLNVYQDLTEDGRRNAYSSTGQ